MTFDVELPLRIISCSGGEHSGGISAQTQIRRWRREGGRIPEPLAKAAATPL